MTHSGFLLWSFVVVTTLAGCTGKSEQISGPPALMAPVAHPIQETIVDWDEYIGRFEASERVEVRSRISGYIQKVLFEDGQNVKVGQTLFIIDQRPLRIELQQAEADLLEAQSQQLRAQSDYERVAAIEDTRAVSQEEVEQRRQIAKAADAQVKAAEAQVNLAKLQLDYSVIKAPISGRISEDFVNAGNYIIGGAANSTLLTTIVQLDPIFFYFEGSEADFLKYSRLNKTGQRKSSRTEHNPVMVKLLDENRYTRRGYMNFVDNELDRSTGTIRGRAVFENANDELESGMFGRLRLLGDGEIESILMLDEAISTNQSQKVVYVVGKDNKVQIRPITIGELYNDKFRVVKEGLGTDDQVVIGNLLKIRPGMAVNPELREIIFELDSTTIL